MEDEIKKQSLANTKITITCKEINQQNQKLRKYSKALMRE